MPAKNTLTCLAVLKVNWDELRKDFIENFVPLLLALVVRRKVTSIAMEDLGTLQNAFAEEWGLKVPHHALLSILNRAKRRGYLRRRFREFHYVQGAWDASSFEAISSRQQRKLEKLLTAFLAFAKSRFKQSVSKEEAEKLFVSFLKDHDLDLLFAAHRQELLPDVKASARAKFLFYSFAQNAHEQEPELFDFLVSLATGHMMATTLLYQEFPRFKGRLQGLCLYLDSHLLFPLVGVGGPVEQSAALELLETLKREQVKVCVFRHNLEEVRTILENALHRLERRDYDLLLASRSLRFFIEENYKPSDVEQTIGRLDSLLPNYGIETFDVPSVVEHERFQESEQGLHEMIARVYSELNPRFREDESRDTIRRDVKSLSAIYRLRKGKRPGRMRDAGHVLVTGSYSLALAARRFEREAISDSFFIPACLTDVFVGTLLWLESPERIGAINHKKILADCYAGLRPQAELLEKYLVAVEKLREAGKVTQEEYVVLRASRVARELLQHKTLGDPELLSYETPEEILGELTEKVRTQEQQRAEERVRAAKGELEAVALERDWTRQERQRIERRLQQLSYRIARGFRMLVLVAVVPIVVLSFLFSSLPELSAGYLRIGAIAVAVILSSLSFLVGTSVLRIGKALEKRARERIYRFLSGGAVE